MKVETEKETVDLGENAHSNNHLNFDSETGTSSSKKISDKKRKYNADGKKGKPIDHEKTEYVSCNSANYSYVSNSVMHINNQKLGNRNNSQFSKFQRALIINNLKKFDICGLSSPFDRRVTSIAWHPKYPKISVAGSKGGQLLLHTSKKQNYSEFVDYPLFPEMEAPLDRRSVLGIKFCIDDPCAVYTASMTGKLSKVHFEPQDSRALIDIPIAANNWFTCLDLCYNRNILMSGDCIGYLYLIKTSGEKISKINKLHSSKISHCEFNVSDPNIFVTSSIDRTVKLWDLRSLSENESKLQPLMELNFDKGVNTACFSPSNRHTLLVTDHHSQLRVYSSPFWNESLIITHPHRHYQHMTSIKAVWHPIDDIIVVGRYPDDNVQVGDDRTFDFYDGSTGELLLQKPSPTKHIISLIAFNSTGDTVFLTAGRHIMFLQDQDIVNGVSRNHGTGSDSESTEAELNAPKKKTRTLKKTNKSSKSDLAFENTKSV